MYPETAIGRKWRGLKVVGNIDATNTNIDVDEQTRFRCRGCWQQPA